MDISIRPTAEMIQPANTFSIPILSSIPRLYRFPLFRRFPPYTYIVRPPLHSSLLPTALMTNPTQPNRTQTDSDCTSDCNQLEALDFNSSYDMHVVD